MGSKKRNSDSVASSHRFGHSLDGFTFSSAYSHFGLPTMVRVMNYIQAPKYVQPPKRITTLQLILLFSKSYPAFWVTLKPINGASPKMSPVPDSAGLIDSGGAT